MNSFYVPLFFILSGVFEPSAFDWRKYGLRLMKLGKYIVIFALFGFLSFGLLRGRWAVSACWQATTVWFLITLFWITVIFGLVQRARCKWMVFVILIGGGIMLSVFRHSYCYIGQALLCLPFYAVGYYYKDYFKDGKFRIQIFYISLFVWLIMFIFYKSPQNISLNLVTQSYITFYIAAFAGSMWVIEACKLFSNRVLAYFGRNSIVPMLVQMAFIWGIARYSYADNIAEYLSYALMVCVACGLSIPLFRNKYYDIFK